MCSSRRPSLREGFPRSLRSLGAAEHSVMPHLESPLKRYVAIVLLASTSALADGQRADINSCANAPADAVVALPAPYERWFSIQCEGIRKAHFVAPAPGFAWTEQNTAKPYRFNAYGPIAPSFSPTELNTYEPHKYHFVKLVPSVMTEQQLPGVNRLLPDGVGPYKVVHQVDFNSNNRVIYSLFTFIKGDSPEWIVACVNFNCGTRATIQVRPNNGA